MSRVPYQTFKTSFVSIYSGSWFSCFKLKRSLSESRSVSVWGMLLMLCQIFVSPCVFFGGLLYYHVNIDIDLVFGRSRIRYSQYIKILIWAVRFLLYSTICRTMSQMSGGFRIFMDPRLLFGGCNVAFNLSSFFFFFIKLRRLCLVRCTLQVPFCLELADVNFYNYYLVSVFVSGFYTFLIFFSLLFCFCWPITLR